MPGQNELPVDVLQIESVAVIAHAYIRTVQQLPQHAHHARVPVLVPLAVHIDALAGYQLAAKHSTRDGSTIMSGDMLVFQVAKDHARCGDVSMSTTSTFGCVASNASANATAVPSTVPGDRAFGDPVPFSGQRVSDLPRGIPVPADRVGQCGAVRFG
jgi:hypothetical protein